MTIAFVSIGQNCTVASWLLKQELRAQSLLFDWARSNLATVREILECGLEYHLQHMMLADYPITYPHRSRETSQDYMTRCAQRFFDTLMHADNLYLIHCAPQPIEAAALLAIENAAAKYRTQEFSILGLYGFTGNALGIVCTSELSPRTRYYVIDADLRFDTNRMHGAFYDTLCHALLPPANSAQLYRAISDVEDRDPA